MLTQALCSICQHELINAKPTSLYYQNISTVPPIKTSVGEEDVNKPMTTHYSRKMHTPEPSEDAQLLGQPLTSQYPTNTFNKQTFKLDTKPSSGESPNVVVNLEVNLQIKLPQILDNANVVSQTLQCGGGIVIPPPKSNKLDEPNGNPTSSQMTIAPKLRTFDPVWSSNPVSTENCISTNPFRLQSFNEPKPINELADQYQSDTRNPFRTNSNQLSNNWQDLFQTNDMAPFINSQSSRSPIPNSTNPFFCLDQTSSDSDSNYPTMEYNLLSNWEQQREPPTPEANANLKRLKTNNSSNMSVIDLSIPISMTKSNCERDLNTLISTVKVLRTSGFYYETISQQQALELLVNKSPGTFLVRNSCNPEHIFTISVQTVKGPTSARLKYLNGYFHFDCDVKLQNKVPKFTCVIKLIEYYINHVTDPSTVNSGAPQQVWLDYYTRKYYSQILLVKPLHRSIPKLQHLCRRVIFRTSLDIDVTSIPFSLVDYLQEYPYFV